MHHSWPYLDRLPSRSTTSVELRLSMAVKSVAVIGTGPSGAIAVDALVQEQAFDVVRVFERQEKAGGCWYVLNALVTLGPIPMLMDAQGLPNKRDSRSP